MRISDWSSDVCSSDLISAWRCLLNFATPSAATVRNPQSASCRADGPMGPGNKCRDDSLFVARASPPCARGVNAAGTTDRKSVVEGKSVSVRVALGGGRIIKKKTRKKNNDKQ